MVLRLPDKNDLSDQCVDVSIHFLTVQFLSVVRLRNKAWAQTLLLLMVNKHNYFCDSNPWPFGVTKSIQRRYYVCYSESERKEEAKKRLEKRLEKRGLDNILSNIADNNPSNNPRLSSAISSLLYSPWTPHLALLNAI